MSTNYIALKKVSARELFDRRLEAFGVREHIQPDEKSRCLTAKGELMEETTMGERGADRLPDFIFERYEAGEAAGTLAGTLLTGIPRHKEPSERDRRLIYEVVEGLKDAFQHDPHMNVASVWRRGGKPPDALEHPFPDAALLARMERCLVAFVRIDPHGDGFLRFGSFVADVMGRH